MTDLVITPANVRSAAGATQAVGTAGEALTAGQLLYSSPTDYKWWKADSNGTPPANNPQGVALHSTGADQPIVVHTSGDINLGATLVAGSAYYLSETPGGIQPAADLGTTENIAQIGLAESTSVLNFRVTAPGVILP